MEKLTSKVEENKLLKLAEDIVDFKKETKEKLDESLVSVDYVVQQAHDALNEVHDLSKRVEADFEELSNQTLEALQELDSRTLKGDPGKDADEEAIEKRLLAKIPLLEDIATLASAKIQTTPASLKIIKESVEIKDEDIVPKLNRATNLGDLKLSLDNIKDWKETRRALESHSKAYVHGGGFNQISDASGNVINGLDTLKFTGSGISSITKTNRTVTVDISGGSIIGNGVLTLTDYVTTFTPTTIPVTGTEITFLPDVNSPANATLNGVIILEAESGTLNPLELDDLVGGGAYKLRYNGTQWILIGAASSSGVTWSAYSQTFNSTTDWGTATSGLYTINILSSFHTFDTNVYDIVVYQTLGSSETQVRADTVSYNSTTGTVSISVVDVPESRFAGKVVIFGKGVGNNGGTGPVYRKPITLADWGTASGGYYTLTVPQATHAISGILNVVAYETVGTVNTQVRSDTTSFNSSTGEVTLKVSSAPDARFLGTAYIIGAAAGSTTSITLTTTGTSGPATLVGNTLNIPVYAGGSSSTQFSELRLNFTGNNITLPVAAPTVTGLYLNGQRLIYPRDYAVVGNLITLTDPVTTQDVEVTYN